MSQVSDFLNALFGFYEGDLQFDLNEEIIYSSDPDFINANASELRVFPETPDGVFFIYQFVEDVSKAGIFANAPTVSLFKDNSAIHCWALAEPVAEDDPKLLSLLKIYDIANPIPLPGVNSWNMTFCNDEAVYNLEDFEIKTASATKYADADVITPYRDADYDRPITVTFGANREARKWTPRTGPLGGFIAKLCQHKIGKKDGPSFVLADMHPGQRLKNAVKTVTGIGLDIDTGTPEPEIDAAIDRLKCLAVRYTTHSHGKTVSEFKKDTVIRFDPDYGEIDSALMKRFCREKQNWYESTVNSIEYMEEDHTEKGIIVKIKHDEMPKNRVIVPLLNPFEIAKEGKTQMEAMAKWAKVPEALAALLKVPFDRSCTDPSRLYYEPRHDKGKPYNISVFGGKLFDWKTLDLDDAFEALVTEINKKGGKSKTLEGKALGKWSMKTAHGFQIANVLEEHCPDRLRGPASSGFNIECPFDDEHSNPGDTTDRACFAVNAADGGNELFIISCRHEGCQKYTNLDMLGRMIKDGWFEKEIIDDPLYNAVDESEGPRKGSNAEKEAKKEQARTEYDIAIEALTEYSSEEEKLEACVLIVRAGLGPATMDTVMKRFNSKIKISLTTSKLLLKKAREVIAKEEGLKPSNRDEQDRTIFRYETAGYDFHDAVAICNRTLMHENLAKGENGLIGPYPTWTHIQGSPVKLVTDPKTNRLTFKEHDQSLLWSAQTDKVVFCRKTDNGDGPKESVPEDVAKHVFNSFYINFPDSPEIIYTPLFGPNGEMISKPGYYCPPENPGVNILIPKDVLNVGEIERFPDADEALTALAYIREEILGDFPFMDHDENGEERRAPSEANALAMLLTPFMRRMITSCTPVFFISKPMAGTGGTLLGKLPMFLFDGVGGAPARYSQNEEEMNKILISELMQPKSHLFFDDVKEFNNRELLRAITSKYIGGRVLGGSKLITRENNYLWIATGNNPLILNEMERRIVWIRLNAKTADIQTRKFKHDLETYLLGGTTPVVTEAHRAKAVQSILTLIQYWISIGMPLFTLRTRQSFEDWAAKVGGVLQAVGVEGFLDNRKAEGQDMDEASIKAFVREWLKLRGADHFMTPIDAFNFAEGQNMDIIEGANEDQKKHRFMRRLPTIEGRTFSIDGFDYMLRSGKDREQNLAYYVTQIGPSEVVLKT